MKLRKFNEMGNLSPEQLGQLGLDPSIFSESSDNSEVEDVEFEDVEEEEEEELDEYTVDPELENIAANIRKIIKSSHERSYAYAEDDAVGVQFILNKTEQLSNLMEIMSLLNGLKTDMLIEYNTEFELWKTTKGDPMITVMFRRKDKDNTAPF